MLPTDARALNRIRRSTGQTRLGRWRIRGSIERLAKRASSSTGAATGLALALEEDEFAQLVAYPSLLQVIKEEGHSAQVRNGVSAAWVENRSALIAGVLKYTRLRPTASDQSAALVLVFFDGANPPSKSNTTERVLDLMFDQDSAIARAATKCVAQVTTDEAWDTLVARWVQTRDDRLRQMIESAQRLPIGPTRVRVLVRLLIKDQTLEGLEPQLLPHVEEAINDPDVGPAADAVLRRLKHPESKKVMCVRALQGDEFARSLCIESGYVPDEDHERALFLFLTEQWDRYAAVDFDGSLLATAYDIVDEATQLRLRRVSASTGRGSALRIILGGDRTTRIRTLHRQEAEFLIAQLAAGGDYEGIWKLVFELPFEWAMGAMRTLLSTDWRPHHHDEAQVWEVLMESARAGVDSSLGALTNDLPLAVRRADVRFNGRINALAFSPDGRTLAIASNQRTVGFWDLKRGRLTARHKIFSRSVGHVIVLEDGSVVAAERTNTPNNTCSVWKFSSQKWRRVGEHSGSVTGLISVGPAGFATSGRDRFVRIYRTSQHRPDASVRLADWPRAFKSFGDGRRAIAVHRGVSVVDLLNGTELSSHSPFDRIPVDLAVGPGTDDLVVGFRDGRVLALTVTSWGVHAPNVFAYSNVSPITAIEAIPARSLVMVGRQEQVDVVSWPSRLTVGSLSAREGVASITVGSTGEFLAIGHSEDRASLWDMRVSSVPAMFSQPLIDTRPAHLAILEALDGSAGLNNQSLKLVSVLRRMLRHRFRHDIEIDQVPEIKAGRFDIAID